MLINLDKIRFGPRAYKPPPIQLSFLPPLEKPKKSISEGRKKRDDPGYDRYQLRLW